MREKRPSEQAARPPRSSSAGVETSSGCGRALGPECKEGGVASLPAKLDRYGTARRRAREIMAYLDGESNGPPSSDPAAKAASNLKHCGEYLLFRHYHTVDEVRLHAASFCRQHLVCPLCAVRRSSKQAGAYLQKFEAVTEQEPALRPVFITYTVKNGRNLAERMDHLRNALRKLTAARRQARKRGSGVTTWRHIAGAVGALEATYDPKTGWHPHMHMVALCDGWMDQAAMSREWKSVTGDSFVVGISALDRDKPASEAFLETFKYAVKFSDLTPALTWEAAKVLKGQRLVFSLGNMRGVEVPEHLTDEPLDGLPFFERMYRYLGGGHYGLSWHTTE
ncbi:replication protein Rep (plasmid) [Phaeobacter inhibens]|nr:replication protein Rep [Phaeobacter inhibens]AUR22583.1 replication protein Rep [Phaeobacter inhibens]